MRLGLYQKTLINLVMLSLLLTTGCAGKFRLDSRNCKASRGTWDIPDRLDFYIQQKVWSNSSMDGDVEPIRLVDVMRENDVDCPKIKRMNVTVERTWSDVFLSFIPFSSRSTLTIEGTYLSPKEVLETDKRPMKDDGSPSKDGETR